MENKTCQYKDCNEPVNSPHDEKLCVFHAPKEKKGITVEQFNELIWRRINDKCLDFREFIFPGDISFRGECRKEGGPIVFAQDVDFSGAQFSGVVSFYDAQFSERASFIGAEFSGEASFPYAQFSANASYRGAQFSGDASFHSAQFSGSASYIAAQFSGDALFHGAQFSGEASFRKARFSRRASFASVRFLEHASFTWARFSGDAEFWVAQFSGNGYFADAQFLANVYLESAKIRSVLDFSGIKLGEKAVFYFQSPIFEEPDEEGPSESIGLIFSGVRFNPFSTLFERISAEKSQKRSNWPTLIFRYCQLKDVFFTKSDMSLFSFYKSSFDEARFISSRWSDTKDKILGLIPYRRKNIIPEENMQWEIDEESNEKNKIKLREKYMVQDLAGPDDIASLYRRMKTALDRSKDYEQSGWFYFNEFEMKRRALKEQVGNRNILKKIFSRLLLYNIYKTFAGYGEKPLWSFWWFLIFSTLFSIVHMINGLERAPSVHRIEYSLSKMATSLFSIQFWKDFIAAWSFSLSRLIPANYLSAEVTNYYPVGGYGSLISFLNFVVLFVMATFIFIGLKRHFRRF